MNCFNIKVHLFQKAVLSTFSLVLLILFFYLAILGIKPVLAANEKIPFLPGDSIAEIEAKITANGYNFTVAPNWITRLSAEEKERLFSRHQSFSPKDQLTRSSSLGPLLVPPAAELPERFDWRDYQGHSYIGPVRNQGSCGACYAFGACAAAEGVFNVAHGLYDENCLDLSEAFLAFCLDQYYDGFSGCTGSSYDYEELDALVEQGVCRETVYPYRGFDEGCIAGVDSAYRFKLDEWYRLPCGDITAIKAAIMTYGVVDAAVYVSSAFNGYAAGIYEDTNTSCDADPCYNAETNHCIALVGWDDNDGDGYWILRNSWGQSWGEDGYMRIAYDSAHISCAACYMVPLGQISGVKWSDFNGDGIRDASDSGLSHWKIYADINLNNRWDIGEPYSLTDQDGNYILTDLKSGTYVITEEQQPGWIQTFPGGAASSSSRDTLSTRLDLLSESQLQNLAYMIIDSPPTPPPASSRATLRQLPVTAVSLQEVPTSCWTYGCSATSAGMLFGYYDRVGYGDMYSGPANGGLAPLTDLGQGIGSTPIAGSCSIIATKNGFDGRTMAGHVDDYWFDVNEPGPDPWEASGNEHAWGECTADFMGTNQYRWDLNNDGKKDANRDGSTIYYFYSSGDKLYDPIPGGIGSDERERTALCHGLRLFAESRGYEVTENYNQVIDQQATEAGKGFTFNDFKQEIDSGCPVLIHVTGHTMIGIGYDDTTQTVYLHDTWDNLQHSMVWGGGYGSDPVRIHQAVTVIHLEPIVPAAGTYTVVLSGGESVSGKDFGNNGSSITDTVKIDWANPAYFQIIQNGYDEMFNGDRLKTQIGNFTEDLYFDRDLSITLRGGYSSDFSQQVGWTNLIGSLTIGNGNVVIERLIIE